MLSRTKNYFEFDCCLMLLLGVVLKELPVEAHLHDDDGDEKHLAVTHKFKDFTYWNLDSTPSDNDKIMQVMKWIDIANVVYLSHSSLISVVLSRLTSRKLEQVFVVKIRNKSRFVVATT